MSDTKIYNLNTHNNYGHALPIYVNMYVPPTQYIKYNVTNATQQETNTCTSLPNGNISRSINI